MEYGDWTGGFDLPGGGDIGVGGGITLPDAGSVFDVLGKVGNAIGGVAKTVADFQTARETTAFEREKSAAELQIKRMQVQGGVDTERYRIAQQSYLQQAQLAASQGLSQLGRLFGLGSPGAAGAAGGGMSVGMIALLGVGGYLVWKKFLK